MLALDNNLKGNWAATKAQSIINIEVDCLKLDVDDELYILSVFNINLFAFIIR